MHKLFLVIYTFVGVVLYCSCAKQNYYIYAHTKRDDVGNYIIKWEVRPEMDGRVDLFVSDDPNSYPAHPFVSEEINKQVAKYVTLDNVSRKFFMLVFDRKDIVVTGARVIPTFGPFNLRDIGGYPSSNDTYVRWGKVYRSGRMDKMSYRDSLMVQRLGIRTRLLLLDGQSIPGEFKDDIPSVLLNSSLNLDRNELLQQILAGKATVKEVKLANQNYLHQLAFHNKAQFAMALQYLLETKNYPILISDQWGKDRVAYLMMLIQCILNINRGYILDDYLQSNDLLTVAHLIPGGYQLSNSQQEALTEFFRCRSRDINKLFADIEKHYGSVSKYLEKELNFTMAQQVRLRQILLQY